MSLVIEGQPGKGTGMEYLPIVCASCRTPLRMDRHKHHLIERESSERHFLSQETVKGLLGSEVAAQTRCPVVVGLECLRRQRMAEEMDLNLVNGGRCAAQAETMTDRANGQRHRLVRGWVQCGLQPGHDGRHVWGTDNQVTPAEPFA
jgi:hypothetical protein